MLVREEAVWRAESSSGYRGEAEAGRVLPPQPGLPGPGVVKGSGMQEVRYRCANSSQQAATVASHGARATQRADDLKSRRRKMAPSWSWSMCRVGTLTSQVAGRALGGPGQPSPPRWVIARWCCWPGCMAWGWIPWFPRKCSIQPRLLR